MTTSSPQTWTFLWLAVLAFNSTICIMKLVSGRWVTSSDFKSYVIRYISFPKFKYISLIKGLSFLLIFFPISPKSPSCYQFSLPSKRSEIVRQIITLSQAIYFYVYYVNGEIKVSTFL